MSEKSRNNKKQEYSEDEIQELIVRVQDGDSTAFDQIYKLFVDAVYQFVWFKVGHNEAAEDLTSIVFVKVWQALDRYHPKNGAKFSTWLFQIARFTVIDYYRTSKPVDDIENVQYRLKSSEDIESDVSRNQDALVIHRALANLPEKYQTVLTMRFINDFSVAETAAALKLSEGHVRVLQHRGLKKMRELLGDESADHLFETVIP